MSKIWTVFLLLVFTIAGCSKRECPFPRVLDGNENMFSQTIIWDTVRHSYSFQYNRYFKGSRTGYYQRLTIKIPVLKEGIGKTVFITNQQLYDTLNCPFMYNEKNGEAEELCFLSSVDTSWLTIDNIDEKAKVITGVYSLCFNNSVTEDFVLKTCGRLEAAVKYKQ